MTAVWNVRVQRQYAPKYHLLGNKQWQERLFSWYPACLMPTSTWLVIEGNRELGWMVGMCSRNGARVASRVPSQRPLDSQVRTHSRCDSTSKKFRVILSQESFQEVSHVSSQGLPWAKLHSQNLKSSSTLPLLLPPGTYPPTTSVANLQNACFQKACSHQVFGVIWKQQKSKQENTHIHKRELGLKSFQVPALFWWSWILLSPSCESSWGLWHPQLKSTQVVKKNTCLAWLKSSHPKLSAHPCWMDKMLWSDPAALFLC